MQFLDGRLVHSASDLNAFTECLHLTALERAAALGRAVRPERDDPTAALLARKGDEHEARHLARLGAIFGDRLTAFTERPVPTRAGYAAAQAESVAAMARGDAVIYQATFFDGEFLGRADFLRRVERPSRRWAWSYEVVDTKLALSAKPYFLIQLCNYSEHVARIQGSAPEFAAIVLGTGSEQRFRLADFMAYYRRLRREYLAAVDDARDEYPFECAHCDLCAWHDVCARRRDADDHLSLVAGIRRDQIAKLEGAAIATLSDLASAADARRPKKLNAETFAALRAQAAEQHRYRRARAGGAAVHSYAFRDARDAVSGFARLPEPDAGDVFFDMEGDPLYRPDRALEYLFGIYLPAEDAYVPFWGTDPAAERRAFEAFIDYIVDRQRRYPGLHVYHYAPYEMTALKRLMGRYASREGEIDGFLRAGTFVDLFPVVKQSVWISQPSYSIKKLEALYGFSRATQTRAGDDSIVMFESWLQTGAPEVLEDIRAYNEDDCRSTYRLREWLVRLRAERNAQLTEPIPWRAAVIDQRAAADAERSTLAADLLDGLPAPDSLAELRAAAEPVRARWLLGNLLDYHRREQKPEWWEHFERLSHPGGLVDDSKSLGGLTYVAAIAPYLQSARDRLRVHTFRYPAQEHELRSGDKPLDAATGNGAGTVVSIDDRTSTLELKVAQAVDPGGLRALVPAKPRDDAKKRAAIEHIARAYRAGKLEADHPATLALLLGRLPRLRGRPSGAAIQPRWIDAAALSAAIAALDGSYLVVQGPPGTGKSTLGAQAIVDLIAAGKRIALAAHSHKALHGLLAKVQTAAQARGVTFAGCHKSTKSDPASVYRPAVPGPIADTSTPEGFAGCALVSATTFAWAEPGQLGAFDVVVIDEAGQVPLADALVTSLIARNVVLLGDPRQLPNVSKGSHPLGTDGSILEHLLADAPTVAVDRGIFLDRSYRLQPRINAFVSHAFYAGRLVSDERNAANRITVAGADESGPSYVTIDHAGNTRRSPEEAEYIACEIARLLECGTVSLRGAAARPLTQADILVVAPYNMQRILITELLAKRGLTAVSVGTVDKFQGQEAPVVFFSMTSSSAKDAPRGLGFLLSPNRLNVAVSRAQARCTLVFGSQLLASPAGTIETMQLLNLLCEFVEYAGAPAYHDDALQLPFAFARPACAPPAAMLLGTTAG